MKIATIKTLVRATGWKPSYTSHDRPGLEQLQAGIALAKKQGLSIHNDGRCYVPFQPFVRRSLRKNPKAPG